MKTHIAILSLALCAGCVHKGNISPADSGEWHTIPTDAQGYPKLPPAPILGAPMHVVVDNGGPPAPVNVQCGSLSIHVGKLDVDAPKGVSLDMAGVKGETKAYHILLEDVTFTHQETCLR